MSVILAIIGSRRVEPSDDNIHLGLLDCSLAEWGAPWRFSAADIEAVICGDARGADLAGARWAGSNNIMVIHDPITAEDVARWGKYLAPKARNGRIADRATHCLAFWDCQSNGTTDCMARFLLRGKPVACIHLKPVRKPRRVRR